MIHNSVSEKMQGGGGYSVLAELCNTELYSVILLNGNLHNLIQFFLIS